MSNNQKLDNAYAKNVMKHRLFIRGYSGDKCWYNQPNQKGSTDHQLSHVQYTYVDASLKPDGGLHQRYLYLI